MITCTDLIEKSSLESYYEFLFVMALGAECGRRGEVLDLRGLRIADKGMLSKKDIEYMHYLKGQGFIYDGTDSSKTDRGINPQNLKYYFDTSYITDMYDCLFEDIGYNGEGSYDHSASKLYEGLTDCYAWSSGYANSSYPIKYYRAMVKKGEFGKTLLNLMAHMIVCFYAGDRKVKSVKFILQSLESSTVSNYLDLYACSKTIPVLEKYVDFVVDENYRSNIGDMDLIIHYNMAKHAGRYRSWSANRKYEAFEELGFTKGQIFVLYTRGRVTDANPAGKITGSSILRLDDVWESKTGMGITVTQFSLNKTIEERLDEYREIDDDYKHMFADMKNPKLSSREMSLSFQDVGVGLYFHNEDKLIMPIEQGGTVTKKVTVNGKEVALEMSEVDAIYWILCQYDVDFDRELYREYYNNGEAMRWDKVDATPNIKGV